jgi:hypothetical protein
MGQNRNLPMGGRRKRRIAITVGLAALSIAAGPVLQAGEISRAAALQQFLAPEQSPLTSYRALRRLSAATRGGRMAATIIAWTELHPDRGFRYEIVSRSGSPAVQNRALIPALDLEAGALKSGAGEPAALVLANYRFDDAISGEGDLVRIGITPNREAPMLLKGAMFLRPDTGDLVRVEGRLVKRPSFWTRRVDVVRHYARVAGVRVPIGMESTGHVLILGPSSFAMTWEYESVNGIPVGTPGKQASATRTE